MERPTGFPSLESVIRQIIADLTGKAPESIDLEKPLTELGMTDDQILQAEMLAEDKLHLVDKIPHKAVANFSTGVQLMALFVSPILHEPKPAPIA